MSSQGNRSIALSESSGRRDMSRVGRPDYESPPPSAPVCGDPLTCYGPLLGRILVSPIFLFSGFMKVLNWSATVEHMAEEGMVAVPFFLAMAIAFEIGGGLAILFGCHARLGALALIAFLIPTTLIFHDFWTYDGMAQQNQLQHFMKNLTILGGLFFLVSWGSGAFSVDRLWQRRAEL